AAYPHLALWAFLLGSCGNNVVDQGKFPDRRGIVLYLFRSVKTKFDDLPLVARACAAPPRPQGDSGVDYSPGAGYGRARRSGPFFEGPSGKFTWKASYAGAVAGLPRP